ncbi:MAG: Holliday junction resolvase RuvX [Oscillospiraceae bacterium]|nr:Holliday junction resolvase RuvX [Oscillospiraceae bacterium]
MRVMAIDYGDQHTGVAFSDLTGSIAGEAFTVDEWNQERLADKLSGLCRERGAERIVLGYPVNMDGSAGPRAEKSLALAALLRDNTGLEVIMWDERRTTVDAHRILSENGRRTRRHKKNVDAVAATLILEAYLGSLRLS